MGKLLQNYTQVVTRGYGDTSVGGYPHGGIDIVGNNGQCNVLDYICAFDKGTVVNVRKDCTGFEDNGSYGNFVHIDHGNGYSTVYAHLSYGSVNVNLGDTVEKGQVIAYMGNTGHSYGGHLHFEVRIWNEKTDPTDYAVNGKEFPSPLPTPVERNENEDQLFVTCENTMRVRKGHSTNDEVIGFATYGYYNIINSYIDDQYTWLEVEENKWIALMPPYCEIMARIQEKQEESINTNENTETSENEPKNDEIIEVRNQDKSNPLLELIKLIIEVIRKYFIKGEDK